MSIFNLVHRFQQAQSSTILLSKDLRRGNERSDGGGKDRGEKKKKKKKTRELI